MPLFVLRFTISTVNQKGTTWEIRETPPGSLAHIEMDGQTWSTRGTVSGQTTLSQSTLQLHFLYHV